MRPIFHLSIPVTDLVEALAFYTGHLGAELGRQSPAVADVFVFGAQLTLHENPDAVPDPSSSSRHFGATLDWSEWAELADRVSGLDFVLDEPRISFSGEAIEQGKLMICDPSGNHVEVKAYRNPDQVLGPLVETEG
jgi:extradiol dioxygenase family protein